jgi:hypothetical protein
MNQQSFMSHSYKMPTKKTTQRAEFVEFDVDADPMDPGIITRESVTVCPFGEGIVCTKPGCMVCDDGVRCCAPGDTCMLEGEENWCVGFRGTVEPARQEPVVGMMGRMPTFPKDPPSFWAMK